MNRMHALGRQDVSPVAPPRLFRAVAALLGVVALLSLLPVRAQAAGAVAGESSPVAGAGKWESLFDGATLGNWMQSNFESVGTVNVENPFHGGPGAIVLGKGTTLTGITWTKGGTLPRTNYEITLEAMKLEGGDFFCGLTFPVGKSACTFIVGGWGGMVVGISSVEYADASENETTSGMEFSDHRWYRIRVRVTDEKIEAWIDDKQMVDLEWKGRNINLRPGDIQNSLPLGIASYMTRAALRDIRLRRL